MTKQHDTILAQFGSEPISPIEIMRATGLSKNQIHNGLQRLKDKGRIVHVGEGLYRIASHLSRATCPWWRGQSVVHTRCTWFGFEKGRAWCKTIHTSYWTTSSRAGTTGHAATSQSLCAVLILCSAMPRAPRAMTPHPKWWRMKSPRRR